MSLRPCFWSELSSSLSGSCCSVDFYKCLQERHVFFLSQNQWSWSPEAALLTTLLVTAIAKRYQWQSHCYELNSYLDSQDRHPPFFLPSLSRVICSKSNRIDSSIFFTVTDSISEFTSPCCHWPWCCAEDAFSKWTEKEEETWYAWRREKRQQFHPISRLTCI